MQMSCEKKQQQTNFWNAEKCTATLKVKLSDVNELNPPKIEPSNEKYEKLFAKKKKLIFSFHSTIGTWFVCNIYI